MVKKFITLLDDYINTKAQREGLPSVAWFADKCCLSTGYFGTLVKTETGRAAKDIIADRLLSHAKQLLNDDKLTITIISNRLGFDYPSISSASSRHIPARPLLHTGRHLDPSLLPQLAR